MLKIYAWWPSGTSLKEQGSPDLTSSLWGTKGLSKALGALGLKGLKQIH